LKSANIKRNIKPEWGQEMFFLLKMGKNNSMLINRTLNGLLKRTKYDESRSGESLK
jgi:hypothetical protein